MWLWCSNFISEYIYILLRISIKDPEVLKKTTRKTLPTFFLLLEWLAKKEWLAVTRNRESKSYPISLDPEGGDVGGDDGGSKKTGACQKKRSNSHYLMV